MSTAPTFVGTEKECGDIQQYDTTWDKTNSRKQKALPTFDGKTFEETLFDDPVMVELI
jgi:hypothetical protein